MRYMLDTDICSFIMRTHPIKLLASLEACVEARSQIVISIITYAELKFGAIGKKASPKHAALVSAFTSRLDGILPWDTTAVNETVRIRTELASLGTPIGDNDSAIAGHAIAAEAILVTHNIREFQRVSGLEIEDWVTNESKLSY